MVSLMSSNDSKAEHHDKNKPIKKAAAKSADQPNWFRGALWVPVLNREN